MDNSDGRGGKGGSELLMVVMCAEGSSGEFAAKAVWRGKRCVRLA